MNVTSYQERFLWSLTSSCLTSSLWMWTRRRRTESHFLGVGCTLCPVQCSTLYGIYRCVSKLRFCIFPFTHICCVKYFAFLLSENLLGTMKMLWENSDVGRSPALSCCPDKSLWEQENSREAGGGGGCRKKMTPRVRSVTGGPAHFSSNSHFHSDNNLLQSPTHIFTQTITSAQSSHEKFYLPTCYDAAQQYLTSCDGFRNVPRHALPRARHTTYKSDKLWMTNLRSAEGPTKVRIF